MRRHLQTLLLNVVKAYCVTMRRANIDSGLHLADMQCVMHPVASFITNNSSSKQAVAAASITIRSTESNLKKMYFVGSTRREMSFDRRSRAVLRIDWLISSPRHAHPTLIGPYTFLNVIISNHCVHRQTHQHE